MIYAIGLLGDGGQASENEAYLPPGSVSFRAVELDWITGSSSAVDIASPPKECVALPVIASVGAPALRRRLIGLWRGDRYGTIVAPGAFVGRDVVLSPGTVIAPGASVTTNVQMGSHCLVNVGASVSHGCRLGEFVTIGPGARLGGNVTIGSGAMIGIGASIRNGITIAAGAVVGAGAVVVNDIETENAIVVGSPARILRVNEGWSHEV